MRASVCGLAFAAPGWPLGGSGFLELRIGKAFAECVARRCGRFARLDDLLNGLIYFRADPGDRAGAQGNWSGKCAAGDPAVYLAPAETDGEANFGKANELFGHLGSVG